MPFQIIRNDITRVSADVIVNTANPRPVVGGGTDSAIYRAAGEAQLLAERRRIGDIAPGNAAVTPAFGLSAKHIIHTVGPSWVDGKHGEREILRRCYENSLRLASELDALSIAFPLIATGVYGFPRDEALNIALAEIGKFLLTHEMDVILVVFDKRAFELSASLVGEIDQYIDEHGVGLLREAEYKGRNSRSLRRLEEARRSMAFAEPEAPAYPLMDAAPMISGDVASKSLAQVLDDAGDTFQQRLFKLIDASGMDEVTVYKRANINRKVFSRIRCKPDYVPTKKTAVAFAIALKLDMPETTDLLSRAGLALSPSSKFDLIVSYFVTHGNYDMFAINSALFDYGQPTLGVEE